MSRTIFCRVVVLLCSATMLFSVSSFADDSPENTYVCPPCGHNCLESRFSEPGACGECGMVLVTLQSVLDRQDNPAADSRPKKSVAILLFDGVEIIDYAGPWEIFGSAGFEVFSVARSVAPITTVYGMRVTPEFAIDEHPHADIVLIPGGNVLTTQNDAAIHKWLTATAEEAEVVLSVCNGAFILAKSGLLTGLQATTTRGLVEGLAKAGDDITVVRDVRYVDNGKIITSGGLSAGMDAALHVVSRSVGMDGARRVAQGLEYDWRAE